MLRLIAAVFGVIMLSPTFVGALFGIGSQPSKQEGVVHQASVSDLQSSVEEWDGDAVVMFYAPWCPHCKQLAPVFQDVSAEFGKNSKVSFAKFNCEESAQHMALCEDVQIKHYPTIMFFGHGKLPDSDPISKQMYGTSGTPFDNTAVYHGALYGLGIKDWAWTAHMISTFNHRWQAFTSLLGWGKRRAPRQSARRGAGGGQRAAAAAAAGGGQQEELQLLRAQNQQMAEQLQAMQAALKASPSPHLSGGGGGGEGAAAAAAAEGGGGGGGGDGEEADPLARYASDQDAFALMLENDGYDREDLLAYRTCLGDVTLEYCGAVAQELAAAGAADPGGADLAAAEPFCALAEACLDGGYADPQCRPAACPLGAEGCRYASVCLHPEVVADYQALVESYLAEAQEEAAEATAA